MEIKRAKPRPFPNKEGACFYRNYRRATRGDAHRQRRDPSLRSGQALRTDHLGSTSATSGASTGTQVYFPFGGARATTGAMPTDYGFTGQKLDASDGLMYCGARYYDAALGRFISADTIVPGAGNPQALNRYSYVLNNPVRYVDPSGNCPTAEEGGCERDEHENVIFGEDQEEYGVERPDAVDSCRTANCWGVNQSHNLPANFVPTSNAMPQAFPPPTHGPPSTPIATPQGTPSLPDGTLNATPQASSLPTHGRPMRRRSLGSFRHMTTQRRMRITSSFPPELLGNFFPRSKVVGIIGLGRTFALEATAQLVTNEYPRADGFRVTEMCDKWKNPTR